MRNFAYEALLLSLLSHLLGLQGAVAAEINNSLTEIEAKLLSAPQVILGFEITATGGVEANLQGSLALRGKDEIELTVSGNFACDEIDLMIHNAEDGLLIGAKDSPRTIAMPAALRDSVVIGFTRMGILHNIARLSAGAPPDHSEGGVGNWVTVNEVTKSPDERHLSFDIIVAGQSSGSAKLLLDPFGMVVKRDQTVEFPGGTMVVVENYTNIQVSF